MGKYGFDTDTSGRAVCACRHWQETDVVAGYLLFRFGTEPPEYSVCPDSQSQCLTMVEAMLQNQLEAIAASDGYQDFRYIATCISDILQQCNRRIYELSAYIGQGIAIGGAVIFQAGPLCVATAFGGGRMYFWDGKTLYPQGEVPPADGLVTNALGTRKTWTAKYWHGTIQPGQRFICASEVFPDIRTASGCIVDGSQPGSHDNTVAMLLRKELELRNIPPTAVLEIKNDEHGGAYGPDPA